MIRTPLQRIRQGASFLLVVTLFAVVGYHLLTGDTWLESIYWFVITVSSVGYTERSAIGPGIQFFSIVVIMVGMSAVAYTIGGFLQMMTEGEVGRALGVRRLNRDIKRLSGHVILCGFGRMGQILARELASQGLQIVVIDAHSDRTAEAHVENLLTLTGDATEEEVLVDAGVERARTLVSGLGSDAENMFITLTSRNLNPDLHIVARAEHPSSEKKLVQAGASRVVMPLVTGAQRIARMITRPHTAELIERFSDRDQLDVELDEIKIPSTAPLIGRTVRDAETQRKHRLLVVAVRQAGGEMLFNPDADHVFAAEDTLIVMGRQADVELFRKQYEL